MKQKCFERLCYYIAANHILSENLQSKIQKPKSKIQNPLGF
jgi:hypothetical protein